MTDPRPETVDVWVRLIRAGHMARTAIEDELKRAALPPLAWYDVLLELARAPGGLRPYELERRLLLAQYNLSRLLDRIEKEGYLATEPHPRDGRGRVVTITRAGRALRKRMWPVYAAAIQRHLGTRLTHDETVRLGRLLGRLV